MVVESGFKLFVVVYVWFTIGLYTYFVVVIKITNFS